MSLRAVALLSRAHTRRQRGSLVLVALLVAVVSGVVLAGLAGARRTATVLDRFLVATEQGDLGAYVMGLPAADAPGFFEDIPGVEDAASVDSYLAQPMAGGMDVDFVVVSSPDGRWGSELNRVLVREGRLPATDRADEVALNRPAADVLGLTVGDTLEAETISPGAFEKLVTGQGGYTLDGPVLSPKVVGIIEVGDDLQGSTQQSSALALGSPAFGQRYGGEVAVTGSTTIMRTRGPGTIDRVREAVAPFPQSGVSTAADQWVDTTRSAINVMTVGLLIFAGIALVAGAIAIGQTVSRQMGSGSEALLVSRAMGLTRAERTLAAAAPVLGASVAGSLAGLAIAVASSGLFPMAIARAAEPDPGLRVDPLVLLAGWFGLVVFIGAWALLAARRADRRTVELAPSRTMPALPAVVGLGSSVSPRLGVRLALDRSSGRSNLPTRSVLLGTASAVVGVVAVVVFTASLNTALRTPSSFGWTWTTRPDLLSEGDPQAALEGLAAEHDLEAVGAVLKADGQIGSVAVPLQAFYSERGSMEPPVRTGRLPAGPAEVALGASTIESTGYSIGDSLTLGLQGGEQQDFTVVGEVVGNQMTDTPDLGDVAVVTPEAAAELAGVAGLAELMSSDFNGNMLLTYREGVDESTVEARLATDHQLAFVANSRPTAPGRLLNIADMRSLLVGIAVFLAGIGTLALVHLLVVSTRRRSREFGTLRALGLVRRQLRATVWFQGLTIMVVGLVVGLPLGIALGRWAWQAALDGVGMLVAPVTPWPALVGMVLVAVCVTSLITLAPGARAARGRSAALLRAE